ncbi:MAG TPA: hypothetical protein IAA21_10350, partial [Candidatus Blautia faecigallinarum]|nr:hypothetical protein [Candidatus Blautia faecigallinarum]
GPDRTILKLSFIKSGDKKEKAQKKAQQLETIIQYMKPGEEYKTREIAELLKVKDSRARALMAELVQEEKIKAEGENRGRRYVLV